MRLHHLSNLVHIDAEKVVALVRDAKTDGGTVYLPGQTFVVSSEDFSDLLCKLEELTKFPPPY